MYFKEKKGLVGDALLGVSMGLAFLTKYAAAIYLFPLFVHGFISRKKFKIPLATAIILLLPWMAWSKFTHGTLLVSHSSYITKDLGNEVGRFFTFLLPLILLWSPPPILLLSLPGFIQKVKSDKLNPFVVLLITTITTGIFWPEKDIRYVLFVFVLVVYFAIIFLSRFKKKYIYLVLLAFLVFQINVTYLLVDVNSYQNTLFADAGAWLRDNTPEDTKILAYSYRQVHYFSHRQTYQPPKDFDMLEKYIGRYDASYAIVDTYSRKYAPAYVYSNLDRYDLIKTFKQGSTEVRIYNLTNPSRITIILTSDFENPGGVSSISRNINISKEHSTEATFNSIEEHVNNQFDLSVNIARWRDNAEGAVTLSFDDGYLPTYNSVMPLLNDEGVKATFNLITKRTGGWYGNIELADWEKWSAAARDGHEMASHTSSHIPVDEVSAEVLEDEIRSSKELIRKYGGREAVSFVYPGGAYDEPSKDIVEGYFISARNSDDGLNNFTPSDLHLLKSRTAASYSAEALDGWAHEAEEEGLWLIENYHLVADENPSNYSFYLSTLDFNEHLNYLKSKNLWIAPQSTVAKYIVERENSVVSVLSESSSKIIINITTSRRIGSQLL
jgi:peptidoglycan/xylan/chitin deacetylase (PgdA/CDA1 family)